MADSGGGQTCVVGWQDRDIYTVEMGRGYHQSWFWCITSPELITIANASVEFASVSFTSVNPRLAIDFAGRIMTDTLYCSQKLL